MHRLLTGNVVERIDNSDEEFDGISGVYHTVGIMNTHEHITLLGRLQRNNLITTDAPLTVRQGAGQGGIDAHRRLAQVEHDKVVACAVHLSKWLPRCRHHRPHIGNFTAKVQGEDQTLGLDITIYPLAIC